ncbi:MAG: energy-coupling factor transporter ATPase [Clostridia bacterium]|nr:energy-coupling factor transporter ATPase [Clostridia bacterium]
MARIEIKNLTYFYADGETPVLDDVSLNVNEGEILAIVGHNGSGKSTLAKHMNALLLPYSGTVKIDGMDTLNEENTLSIRQKVGMVFQNPDNQIVTTVVEEDVGFGPENLGIPTDEILSRVSSSLEAVRMSEFAKNAPHMLSGGQKQRVAIAGILAMMPEVLILDEATAMLDPKGRQDVLNIAKKLNTESNMTVVMITQYMEEAVIADRVIVMHEGKIVKTGTPKTVFAYDSDIEKYSLELPHMARLRDGLIEKGIEIPHDALLIEELEKALCPLLQKN